MVSNISSTKPVIFVDLDDTLFQTRRKCAEHPDRDLSIGSISSNGSHSYMTPRQRMFVEWMLECALVVPVTARGTEAYSRVAIPFSGHAIVANGAVILDAGGNVDRDWHAIVSEALEGHREEMNSYLEAGNRRAEELGVSIRSWIVEEEGMATYAVFKENDGDGTRLREIAPEVEGTWVSHHNGNNLALIPPAISKRVATEFLLERILRDGQRPVLGIGDSISDMSYLSLCDWWSAPGRSQISDLVAGAAAARNSEPIAWSCRNTVTGANDVIVDAVEASRRRELESIWFVTPLGEIA